MYAKVDLPSVGPNDGGKSKNETIVNENQHLETASISEKQEMYLSLRACVCFVGLSCVAPEDPALSFRACVFPGNLTKTKSAVNPLINFVS